MHGCLLNLRSNLKMRFFFKCNNQTSFSISQNETAFSNFPSKKCNNNKNDAYHDVT